MSADYRRPVRQVTCGEAEVFGHDRLVAELQDRIACGGPQVLHSRRPAGRHNRSQTR
jgi:translation initiation factor 1 (eIF-1/SUI1)